MGSGNIGATNVTRVFGWYAGLIVFLVDFVKGYFPLWVLQKFYAFHNPWLVTSAALALVVGHCFSPYLNLKGGKGVATSFGCLAFLVLPGAFIALTVYLLVLALTRISAVGSLSGMVALWGYIIFANPEPSVKWFVVLVSIIVMGRHHQNIRRLIKGN